MERYEDPEFFKLLTESYERLLGRSLIPQEILIQDAAKWLYEDAPFAILAHTADADPTFMYGNKAAQKRFGYSWEEITRLPSRLSAQPVNREERQQFLDRVRRDGYSSGYSGIRVTKTGGRFLIEDATLWQLLDEHGTVHGQAVTIPKSTDL
jgi:PAS domain S-box-containing protein